jgi:predicted AAA+ superfamily ATPase
MNFKRTLDLKTLLAKKSHFLLGPRGTGKSWLAARSLAGDATFVDLLSNDVYSRLLRRPSLLDSLVPPGARIVVVDEIQKIPALLDEVHRLIEKRRIRFLLTGSSARKLRHGAANLLGGRAWQARLFPLTSHELGKRFDLVEYLSRGGLPSVQTSNDPHDELRNYVTLYVREEIQAEALVRRLDHFARFLDVAALAGGQELNFEGIANDAGVPARTVASYFELLDDTLMGFKVPAFTRTVVRKAIKRSKFYFFDVGVAGALAKRGAIEDGSEAFGSALEHFILQEVRAYLSYRNLDHDLCYWRSTAQHEVDFVVGDELAIEVKSTERVGRKQLRGLSALREEGLVRRHLVISRDPMRRTEDGMEIMPVAAFLKALWGGRLI